MGGTFESEAIVKRIYRALGFVSIMIGLYSQAGWTAEPTPTRTNPVLRLVGSENVGTRAIATPGAAISLRQGPSQSAPLAPARVPTSSLVLKTADGATFTVDVYEAEGLDLETAITSQLSSPAVPAIEFAPAPKVTTLAFLPAQPNPFRGSITLRFQTPEAGRARLELYDPAGRRVATAYDQDCVPGVYTVPFSRRELATGLYFARLSFTSAATSQTRHASQRLVKVD